MTTSAAGELRKNWRELLGSGLGLGLGIGCYTPLSSLFFRELQQEFSWSRTAATASLLALPATALVLPFIGALVERLGARRVALVSSILLAVCFLGLSRIDGGLAGFYVWFLALNLMGPVQGPSATRAS